MTIIFAGWNDGGIPSEEKVQCYAPFPFPFFK